MSRADYFQMQFTCHANEMSSQLSNLSFVFFFFFFLRSVRMVLYSKDTITSYPWHNFGFQMTIPSNRADDSISIQLKKTILIIRKSLSRFYHEFYANFQCWNGQNGQNSQKRYQVMKEKYFYLYYFSNLLYFYSNNKNNQCMFFYQLMFCIHMVIFITCL